MPIDGKIPATVQVDVDGLDILLRHHGQVGGDEWDYIFFTGLPRFLDLFSHKRIKATFFIVGNDLEDPNKLRLLERIVAEGHEVGNHSMTHPLSLSSLSTQEQADEIFRCEESIQHYLGMKPVGFRAPNFDVGEETAAILQNRGYLYDSSVLAMPYGPLLRWYKEKVSGRRAGASHYLGRAAFGLAPLRPYRLSDGTLWKKGNGLIEVPITTIPFLRFPFHASFNLALYSFGMGNFLFDLGYAFSWCTRTPLNYVFHICELADVGDRRLNGHWGLSLPIEQRMHLTSELLERITRRYSVQPTASFALYAKRENRYG